MSCSNIRFIFLSGKVALNIVNKIGGLGVKKVG